MDVLFSDLRHTLSGLRRDAGFTVMTVLVLGIGIGANTAVFSVVRGTLLRPLPYEDPSRLAMLWTDIASRDIHEATSSYGNVVDWRARSSAFQGLATFDPTSLTLLAGEWPEQISAVKASANFFSVLGVPPEIGRIFSEEEEREQAPVVVLSHALGERWFGGSAAAIGRSVQIEGTPLEVIGVMPRDFDFPDANVDAWLPESLFVDWAATVARRGTDAWRVVGRLAPAVSLEAARAEMSGIADGLRGDFPEANAGLGINVVPLQDQVTGASFRLGLWTLFGAVGLVLLIACANAAHLILARGARRSGEFSVRVALGATTSRLIRQTVTEGLCVSLGGGLVGVLLAAAGVRLFLTFAPADLPRLSELSVDPSILAYAAVVAVATGVVFGTVPALGFTRASVQGLARDGRGLGGTARGRRLQRVLVPLQFALAVVLLFGATLLIRSLVEARSIDLGFQPDDVLVANLSVASESRRIDFYDRAVESVQAIPGVRAAGIIEDVFISGAPSRTITIEGSNVPTAVHELRVDAIAGDFFQAIGAPMLEGRAFNGTDRADAPPVAVVNQTMARRLWPGEPAVGGRFRTGDPSSGAPWIEVVGVVGDMRREGPEREPIMQAFRPYVQAPSRNMNLLVRSDPSAPNIADAVRSRLAAIDETVPLYRVTTLTEASGRYLVRRRFQALLLGLFSAVALALAAAGIYGLMQYSVTERTRELGVRGALGGTAGRLVALVVREGFALALPGLALGLLGVVWISDGISSLLFGVTPSDPANLALTSAILLVVTFLSCYLPARRAARIDPVAALRED